MMLRHSLVLPPSLGVLFRNFAPHWCPVTTPVTYEVLRHPLVLAVLP